MFCVSSVATGDYWDPSVPDAANIPIGLEPPEVKFGGSIVGYYSGSGISSAPL